ncbi:MAG: cell envelope integrity protein TolA [Pseudomonadales bacterium]
MSSNLNYILSGGLAFIFHAAVLGLLLMNWDNEEIIDTLAEQRYYIDAMIIKENPYRVRERKEKALLRNKETQKDSLQKEKAARKKAKNKQRQLNDEAIARAKKLELEEQLAAEAKKMEQEAELGFEDVSQQTFDPETGFSEHERARMEQSLALSILEEQDYRRAVTDDEKAMAYVSQMQQEIIQNWSRPPSARNGMEALLRVFLVPTGEVVNVVVEESSGNDAFDRSALQAVLKAERFQVPPESRQFERNFREFTVLFRPEDLRL